MNLPDHPLFFSVQFYALHNPETRIESATLLFNFLGVSSEKKTEGSHASIFSILKIVGFRWHVRNNIEKSVTCKNVKYKNTEM
jgi:hypothetical protein